VATVSPPTPDSIEWPTTVVLSGFYAGLIGLTVFGASVPWPIMLVSAALLGGLHMSLCHEVLHGHPTPWRRLNEAFVILPAIAWVPYAVYRDSHRLHHEVELTTPGVDPESFYVTDETWARAGALGRGVLWANRTLLGRLLLWPWVTMIRTPLTALRAARTDRHVLRQWLVHLVATAATVVLLCVVGNLPWWVYVVGFNYGGLAFTYIRSFAEHLPVAEGSRSAVVDASWFWSLLFLNNNLHHTHHAAPGAAWYRLRALRTELDSDQAARDGAGWYSGYAELFRRHLVHPFSQPVHPDAAERP
jgi:fatty acid desaturase